MSIQQMGAVVLSLLLVLAGGSLADAVQNGTETETATGNGSDAVEISSCTVLDEPGRYVLTRDLAPTGGVEYESPWFGAATGCLIVAQHLDAGEFVVDGDGHSITGANVEARTDAGRAVGAGVVIDETAATVTDLTVTGWETGVRSWGVTTVDGVTAVENGVGLALEVAPRAVTDSAVSHNDRTGIVAAGRSPGAAPTAVDVAIERNVVTRNGGTGVELYGLRGGRVADNDVSENGGTGLDARESEDLTVTRNRFAANGEHGAAFAGRFFANGASVTHNRLVDNVGSGVRVDGDLGVEIRRNLIAGNGVGVSSVPHDPNASTDPDVPPSPPYRAYVNATHNYWGAETGPASVADPDAPFADPATGALACGDGDAVTEGLTPGVSGVHFDPYLADAPPTPTDPADGDDGIER